MKTYVANGELITVAATSLLKGLLLAVVLQPFLADRNQFVMAANVTASLTRQGNLEIRGDHDANHFEMTHVLLDNDRSLYFLRGRNGTTINGLAEDAFRCEDVTGDLDIRMGYRDDIVDLYRVRVLNNLRIDMGRGDDDVLLTIEVWGNVQVLTREGNDYVWMKYCSLNAVCPPRNSSDYLECDGLIVDTGDGDKDTVLMMASSVGGNARLISRTGTNVFLLDTVMVHGALEILGRAGVDLVYMFDVLVLRHLDIALRTHSDFLFMSGLLVVADLNVSTGRENDFVHGWGLDVRGRTRFDGGHGQGDCLQLIEGAFLGWVAPVGFEHQHLAP